MPCSSGSAHNHALDSYSVVRLPWLGQGDDHLSLTPDNFVYNGSVYI